MTKYYIITLLIFCLTGMYASLRFYAKPTFNADTLIKHKNTTKPRILLVCPVNGLGGGELHVLALYKMLYQHAYPVSLLVGHKSALSNLLRKEGLPFYSTYANYCTGILRPLYHFFIKQGLTHLCATQGFDIIHGHSPSDAPTIINVAHRYGAKAILTRHVPDPFAVEKIKNIDAVIGVVPSITAYINGKNGTNNLGIKQSVTISPFFDIAKFGNVTPTEKRELFLKNRFGITIDQAPIILMIANFYSDRGHKNHPLLFQAIDTLVHKKNRIVEVLLAGDGPGRAYLENLARQRGIDRYVHFLGFTDQIPELLYHADMLVHSASKEAFGIIFLEAGIMKKPAIGAHGTGADLIIVDKKTGLLFNNNDVDDLVEKIEQLLDNPAYAQQLGQQAYNHIIKNFDPAIIFKKHEDVYQRMMGMDKDIA